MWLDDETGEAAIETENFNIWISPHPTRDNDSIPTRCVDGCRDRTRGVGRWARLRRVLLKSSDRVRPFNSHRRPPPQAAVNNPEDDPIRHAVVREEQGLRPGGLGLAITQGIVDELIYNEARNEVIFIKYLD